MSKRSAELEREEISFERDFPLEVKQQIYNSIPLSDPGTMSSLILLDKETFSLVKPWCRRFIDAHKFRLTNTHFHIGSIVKIIRNEECDYFTRENLYLLLKLIDTIANDQETVYNEFNPYIDFKRDGSSILASAVSILDERTHSITPLLKTEDLTVETYTYGREKETSEMSDSEIYAIRSAVKRHEAIKYSINESFVKRIPIDPSNTKINEILLNGKHILSVKGQDLSELLVENQYLAHKSLFRFFFDMNLFYYREECCKITGRTFVCHQCYHHYPENGCTFLRDDFLF